MRRRTRRSAGAGAARTATLFACAALFVCAAAGCNILGPVGYFVHGPARIPAQYELDKARRTIVFIDDRGNRLPRRALRYDIAAGAQEKLIEKAGIKNMIDARSAILAAGKDRRDDPVSIESIGIAVEAEVVVYASVESFALSPDGSTFSPSASLSVKVIDITNRTRLWPDEREGKPLNVQLPPKTGTVPQSLSDVAKAEADLAKATGHALAQMFYSYEKQQAVSK
ncbi:MAG: hypothetical protein RBS39_11285 [Phycisphaerales bacterium]|jgi:hypothetical protein|nr:hypothetical protein [Phycisphaerales bacterium]